MWSFQTKGPTLSVLVFAEKAILFKKICFHYFEIFVDFIRIFNALSHELGFETDK